MEDASSSKAPREVVLAVIGQCACIVTGFGMYAALQPHPHAIATVIVWAVFAALLFFLFRALLRGSNWIRWFLLVSIVIGALALPRQVAAFSERWQAILYIAQAVVGAITVLLLFLPASNRWFSRSAKA